MHRVVGLVLVLATATAVAVPAGAGTTVRITIRHQVQGCHAWSVDNGPWAARHSVQLTAGGTIQFFNDDLMTHRLVQLAGPRLVMPPTMLESTFKHPGGGNVSLRFPRRGTYRFTTVDGDESGKPIETTGPDNVLRLTVRVL